MRYFIILGARTVCGHLKSDYRYSNTVVYNNFPWPVPTDAQRAKIEQTTQGPPAKRQDRMGGLCKVWDIKSESECMACLIQNPYPQTVCG